MNVENIKKEFPKGTRVQLIFTDDEYTKLKEGDLGTIIFVDDIGTVHISWDNGSSLGMCLDVDVIGKVGRTCPKCGKIYTDYPAISRVRKNQEICSSCGQLEALTEFLLKEIKNEKWWIDEQC